ncbi:MAG: hypothetical protein GC206_07120 [Alphaproteobacteria bacterium]|nr:hypothetical protein [Alphaproteobacteria bacterium]
MADKDTQLGWGDEKAAPVVIQNPSGPGRGVAMMLGVALVFALALTGFFGYQWQQVSEKLTTAERQLTAVEGDLKTKLAEQQAVNRVEAAYAVALQEENRLVREGKSPPPTARSPLQLWIEQMQDENEKLRLCVNNPRAAGCRQRVPVTPTPPLSGGPAIPRER